MGLTWVHADLDGADLTVAAQIVQLGYATEQATPKVDSHGVVALDSGTDRVLCASTGSGSDARRRPGPRMA